MARAGDRGKKTGMVLGGGSSPQGAQVTPRSLTASLSTAKAHCSNEADDPGITARLGAWGNRSE